MRLIAKLIGRWTRWRVRRAFARRFGFVCDELSYCIDRLPDLADGRPWRLHDALPEVEWDFWCEWDAGVEWWYSNVMADRC